MVETTLLSRNMPRFKAGTGFMLELSTVPLAWPTAAQLCPAQPPGFHSWLGQNDLQEARATQETPHCSTLVRSTGPWCFADMGWLVFSSSQLWVSHSWCTEMDSGNDQVFISIEYWLYLGYTSPKTQNQQFEKWNTDSSIRDISIPYKTYQSYITVICK